MHHLIISVILDVIIITLIKVFFLVVVLKHVLTFICLRVRPGILGILGVSILVHANKITPSAEHSILSTTETSYALFSYINIRI